MIKTLQRSISILATVAFYSKVAIKKFDGDQLNIFRKVEDSLKSLICKIDHNSNFHQKNWKPRSVVTDLKSWKSKLSSLMKKNK